MSFPVLVVLLGAMLVTAPAKPKSIAFGKWLPVKLYLGPTEEKTLDMRVRPLMVDGRTREFTTGEPHDLTDRYFVVRQAYRLNDSLPDDGKTAPRWKWQRGSWLLVDRRSGRISPLNLPDFDPFYSEAAWFRDYVAYCGISDNGDKLSAIVAQAGRRKPLFRRALGPTSAGELPDSECSAPRWQRNPVRVTFAPRRGPEFTVDVRNHAAAIAPPPAAADDEDGEPQP